MGGSEGGKVGRSGQAIDADATEIGRAAGTPPDADGGPVSPPIDAELDDDGMLYLRLLAKNVQSIQNEDRENELFAEAELLQWDLMMLSETWRKTKEEVWRSSAGHLFLGAGCPDGRRGVAIVVHARHAKGFRAFHAVNERVCAVDIDVQGIKLRIISVYMPDCSYDDAVVEATYAQLDALCRRSRQLQRRIIIAGDWNAVVGMQRDAEEDTVGLYGCGRRNARGEWMVNWASLQNLVITDTCSNGDFEKQWTYVNGGTKRQLDYILVDHWVMRWVTEAQASDDIGIGLDHRTVVATLETSIRSPSRSAKRARRRSNRDWKPNCVDDYQEQIWDGLRAQLTDNHEAWIRKDAEQKCKAIEELLLSAADLQREIEERAPAEDDREHLRGLIQERKAARRIGARANIKEVSKLIRRELRAVDRARKTAKICKILTEFKDIKNITNIRCNGKKQLTGSSQSRDGEVKPDSRDIADGFADFMNHCTLTCTKKRTTTNIMMMM